MRLLLDTHAILWFAWNHAKLSSNARALMSGPQNQLLLSMATIWEIAIKVGTGKLTLNAPYELFMNTASAANGLKILPISVRHAAVLVALPSHHRDPFDRLLIALAQVEQVPIVSADSIFDAYGVHRIW